MRQGVTGQEKQSPACSAENKEQTMYHLTAAELVRSIDIV